jgi:hypothetical protein
VLPGHGVPGGGELYDEMIAYLDFGEQALASSTSAVEFRQKDAPPALSRHNSRIRI